MASSLAGTLLLVRCVDESRAATAPAGPIRQYHVDDQQRRKRVAVVGAGWAGLGAAHHLAKQGYEVNLLEAGPQPGGLVAGWKTDSGRSVEVGIHGFWYPYKNIFDLTDELGIQPFTDWTKSSQYSPAEMPRLPAPLGTFAYTQFTRLPLADRLTAVPLLQAVIDFDNSDEAWQRYDKMSARELFRNYGCSSRLYDDAFNPMLLVGLFAPGEACSAAAALGMLYYFILAHQPDFDVVWCRGTVGETIFAPLVKRIEALGGRFHSGRRVTDLDVDQSGKVTGVRCGEELFSADAVVFAVGISGLQRIAAGSDTLKSRAEFVNISNLGGIDVLAVRLWLDKKVDIPKPSNACFGFDTTTGWTFFDLNALHDEFKAEPYTVVEADFYHANQLLPMTDDQIVERVLRDLATCLPGFRGAKTLDRAVVRFRRAVTHFSPGSYQYLMRPTTSFPNVYMSGDWIVNRHGSWSQEKAYVTGLEAANNVIDLLGHGEHARIMPVEADEPHVAALRQINRTVRTVAQALPFADYFIQ
eukprot:jgi/Chlat1/6060/Chrsp4S06343